MGKRRFGLTKQFISKRFLAKRGNWPTDPKVSDVADVEKAFRPLIKRRSNIREDSSAPFDAPRKSQLRKLRFSRFPDSTTMWELSVTRKFEKDLFDFPILRPSENCRLRNLRRGIFFGLSHTPVAKFIYGPTSRKEPLWSTQKHWFFRREGERI